MQRAEEHLSKNANAAGIDSRRISSFSDLLMIDFDQIFYYA